MDKIKKRSKKETQLTKFIILALLLGSSLSISKTIYAGGRGDKTDINNKNNILTTWDNPILDADKDMTITGETNKMYAGPFDKDKVNVEIKNGRKVLIESTQADKNIDKGLAGIYLSKGEYGSIFSNYFLANMSSIDDGSKLSLVAKNGSTYLDGKIKTDSKGSISITSAKDNIITEGITAKDAPDGDDKYSIRLEGDNNIIGVKNSETTHNDNLIFSNNFGKISISTKDENGKNIIFGSVGTGDRHDGKNDESVIKITGGTNDILLGNIEVWDKGEVILEATGKNEAGIANKVDGDIIANGGTVNIKTTVPTARNKFGRLATGYSIPNRDVTFANVEGGDINIVGGITDARRIVSIKGKINVERIGAINGDISVGTFLGSLKGPAPFRVENFDNGRVGNVKLGYGKDSTINGNIDVRVTGSSIDINPADNSSNLSLNGNIFSEKRGALNINFINKSTWDGTAIGLDEASMNINIDSSRWSGNVNSKNKSIVNIDLVNDTTWIGGADNSFDGIIVGKRIKETLEGLGFSWYDATEFASKDGIININVGKGATWLVNNPENNGVNNINTISGRGVVDLTTDENNKTTLNIDKVINPINKDSVTTTDLTFKIKVKPKDSAKTSEINIKEKDVDLPKQHIEIKNSKEAFEDSKLEEKIYLGSVPSEDIFELTTLSDPGSLESGHFEVITEKKADKNYGLYLLRTKRAKQTDVANALHSFVDNDYGRVVRLIQSDTLFKRLGDVEYNTHSKGVWVRYKYNNYGQVDKYRSKGNTVQVGYDMAKIYGNYGFRSGISYEFGNQTSRFIGSKGQSHIDTKAITLYQTVQTKDGLYGQLTARAGRLKNDMTAIDRSATIRGKFSNNMYGMGVELGKKIKVNEKISVIPQTQLQFTRISGANYETNYKNKVNMSGVNSLIGRIGGRVSYEGEKFGLFTDMSVYREFKGEQQIRLSDATTGNTPIERRSNNKGSWATLGVGVNVKLTASTSVSLMYEQSYGNGNRNSSELNLTLKTRF